LGLSASESISAGAPLAGLQERRPHELCLLFFSAVKLLMIKEKEEKGGEGD